LFLSYIDEAGNGQTLDPRCAQAPPLMVIGGVIVPHDRLRALTIDFIAMKKKFDPALARLPQLSDVIRAELKGSNVRQNLRSHRRNARRRGYGIVDHLVAMLERHQCRVLARIWVKEEGVGVNEAAMYGSSVAALCENVDRYVASQSRQERAMMILDIRTRHKDVGNVHCITTRKYRKGGDVLPAIAESPVLGHSDTLVGLQVADLLVSSLLFPAACAAYAEDLEWNAHCHPEYAEVRERYMPRIAGLQYRYRTETGKWTGGVVVSDRRRRRPGADLFACGDVPAAVIPAPARSPESKPGALPAPDLLS
jgi:hypothetical protein